jgi:hypothetical protein
MRQCCASLRNIESLLSSATGKRKIPSRPVVLAERRRTEDIVIEQTVNHAGLRLFTSNRLETLAGKLAETMHAPLPSPVQAEIVVVQSQGMARWLQLELARRLGVCANVRFPFPKAFVWEVFVPRPAVPDQPDFDPETLAWRLMRLCRSWKAVLSLHPSAATSAAIAMAANVSSSPTPRTCSTIMPFTARR